MASLAFTQALTFDERSAPLAYKLRFGLVVYAISSVLLYIGPALLLWNVYRRVLDGLCSSLTTVDPASLQLARLPSTSYQAVAILLLTGLLLLTLGIFFAISYRP
jgi:hypothetical protein